VRSDAAGTNVHTTIDVRSSDGELLPRLIKPEERELLRLGLERLARDELGALTGEEVECIRRAVDDEQRPGQSASGRLLGVAAIRYLLEIVSTQFVTAALIPATAPARLVLEYSFEEPLVWRSSSGPRWWRPRWLGTRHFEVKAPAVADCRSYHLNVEVPETLLLSEPKLWITRPSAADPDEKVPDGDRFDSRAHFHVSEAPAGSTARLVSSLELRYQRAPRSAFVVAVINAGAVLGAIAALILRSRGWAEVNFDSSSATALMLLVPALITAAVARTDPSEVSSLVHAPARTWTWLSGVGSVIAAATIATRAKGWMELAGWGLAGLVSALALVLLTQQYLSLRKRQVG
jgi:hypothetical protein